MDPQHADARAVPTAVNWNSLYWSFRALPLIAGAITRVAKKLWVTLAGPTFLIVIPTKTERGQVHLDELGQLILAVRTRGLAHELVAMWTCRSEVLRSVAAAGSASTMRVVAPVPRYQRWVGVASAA